MKHEYVKDLVIKLCIVSLPWKTSGRSTQKKVYSREEKQKKKGRVRVAYFGRIKLHYKILYHGGIYILSNI